MKLSSIKKLSLKSGVLSLIVLVGAAISSTSVQANHDFNNGRYPRLISILGQGVGGTTHGDKSAACQRAEDRAVDDAYGQCSMRRGYLVNYRYGSCSCTKKSGSRDDYTCRATVRAECEVR